MESVIVSSENVRPSFPTPQNLRTYKFSMLDQLSQSMLVPFVLCYPNNTIEISDPNLFASQTTEQLKRSLSVILTRFYPLAGRVNRDGQSVDCNDQGVPFVIANFGGHNLSDLLRNPEQKLLRQLVPCEIIWGAESGPDSSVMMIQVNYFDCGGIAVGIVFSHKVADGVTIAKFLNSWAAATRGFTQPVCPNYILQSIFPHKPELPRQFGSPEESLKTGKSVVKRYVFDASAISSLKSRSTVECPTRVEVVSALIWKCFMAASLAHNNSASAATHMINLRTRSQPTFSSDSFGNFLWIAVATSSNKNENDMGLLVRKTRDAISEIDNDYIHRMSGDEGLSGFYQNIQLMLRHFPKDALHFTSWCNLGGYSTDFGWGTPIWIARCDIGCYPNMRFANTVCLMDTSTGDGIEAWINLDEKYMSVFDNAEELRALASIDPILLDIPTTVTQI